MKKELVSITEAAKLLGISREAVFKKIKGGKLKASRVGKTYVIKYSDLEPLIKAKITPGQRKEIEIAVHKTVDEYGEALEMLKDT